MMNLTARFTGRSKRLLTVREYVREERRAAHRWAIRFVHDEKSGKWRTPRDLLGEYSVSYGGNS